MATAVLEPIGTWRELGKRAACEPPRDGGVDRCAGPSLDDLITRLWDDLKAGQGVACPACGAQMAPRRADDGGAPRGVCGACSTELS